MRSQIERQLGGDKPLGEGDGPALGVGGAGGGRGRLVEAGEQDEDVQPDALWPGEERAAKSGGPGGNGEVALGLGRGAGLTKEASDEGVEGVKRWQGLLDKFGDQDKDVLLDALGLEGEEMLASEGSEMTKSLEKCLKASSPAATRIVPGSFRIALDLPGSSPEVGAA